MNRLITILIFTICMTACAQKITEYESYNQFPVYPNENLWLTYTPQKTTFKLWSPVAQAIKINLYNEGSGGDIISSIPMKSIKPGLWRANMKGDHNGKYFTYQVKYKNEWLEETPGIYATAVGVNGNRAMILNSQETDPIHWSSDRGPDINRPNEAIIYELHVRDITTNPNAGSTKNGKYLGLVETGTRGPSGIATCIDHMKELGITHVHLLPSYDHYSINEEELDRPQFNWGYEPQNFNVPEGSYSSDPFNAEVRIKEFKQMVKGFHDAGIGVILDVVYNHTGRNDESNFNLEVPGYYYRFNEDGSYSNASGCGNETASERTMMRKYIIESVSYWAKEYHLDGFRFDLMGIHDQETMNEVAAVLKKIDPRIFVYGEGWTSGGSPLAANKRAIKNLTHQLSHITAFSDDIRDGLKGSVFDDNSTGFVSGAKGMEESVKFGVVGAIQHSQIDYKAVNYSDAPWAKEPWQSISYVSCHDNHTLFDKLTVSRPDATAREITAMHKLANAVVLTSQGVPFLHAGVEMMRTKGGEHNSFESSDAVNQIDWQWKISHEGVFDYHKNLILLRKNHPAFFLPTAELVRKNLRFLDLQNGMVGFELHGASTSDPWKKILVVYNANIASQKILLDDKWRLAVEGDQFNENGIREIFGAVNIPPISMIVAFQN